MAPGYILLPADDGGETDVHGILLELYAASRMCRNGYKLGIEYYRIQSTHELAILPSIHIQTIQSTSSLSCLEVVT